MIRARSGDRAAFGLLAAGLATRYLAASRRILRDLDLAEDATPRALVAIWRHLPQLRDPARFDAWSYRLLVRACYAEGRRTRQWAPNLRILPADPPPESGGLDTIIARDQLETAIRRLSVDHRTILALHCVRYRPLDMHIYAQGPGQRWHMWVLDVGGVRSSSKPMTSPRRHRPALPRRRRWSIR